jgi:hypothetical protein
MDDDDGNRKRKAENEDDDESVLMKKLFRPDDTKSIPDEIQVIGAGISEANGVYPRVDDVNDAPCYVKDGTWKDQSAKFRIYRYCYDEDDEDGPWQWFLDVEEDHIVYRCSTNSSMVAPKSGWKIGFANNGKEPVPIVHYGKNYPLDWRIDPTLSRSDYTIRITTPTYNDNNTVTTDYHVHRASISLGERASGYFANVFGCGSFAENSESMSKIELHPLAAEWFPVMLDYLYGANKLRVRRDNGIILLFLARYFDCDRMLREIHSYCEEDMNADLCGEFYEQATSLQFDDNIIDYVHKYCVDNIESFWSESKIVKTASISFWESVLNAVTVTPDNSIGMSNVIAGLCMRETEPLADKHLFKRMTEGLTRVSLLSAPTLFECELRLLGCRNDRLSQLQELCISAIAEQIGGSFDKSHFWLPEGCPAIVYNRLLQTIHSSVKTLNTQLRILRAG